MIEEKTDVRQAYIENAIYEYREAKAALEKVCNDNALAAAIVTDIYPARISIIQDVKQMNMFDAIDENGEIGSVEMIMGAQTVVSASMKRAIPADVLKKLIRKAEAVFDKYLRAFRAETIGESEAQVEAEISKALQG